jgi:hypothetical protein
VPANPLELVVDANAPDTVFSARVAELRGTALFQRLAPYIERNTCLALRDWDDLLTATERAVLASQGEGETQHWLLVLKGQYTPAQAQKLFQTIAQRAPHNTTSERERAENDARIGRFDVDHQGGLSMSLPNAQTIVIGTPEWLRTALTAIDTPTPSFADSQLWRELAARASCEQRPFCGLTRAESPQLKPLARLLSGVGARALATQLTAADTALTVTPTDGAQLAAIANFRDASTAAAVQRDLERLLNQVGLITTLAGLPNIFGATRFATEDHWLRAEVALSIDDIRTYEERALPMLAGRGRPRCVEVP